MKKQIMEYWKEASSGLFWFHPWNKVLDVSSFPKVTWFKDGKTNIAYNAVDVHAISHRRNKVALVWESEPGQRIRYTYFDLARESKQFANVLKSLGIKRGDKVVLFMPNIPETIIAMLAVPRLGAILVPVNVRYGPFVLKKILKDTQAKVLITANGYYRKGQPICLRPTVESALSGVSEPSCVVMVKRLQEEEFEARDSFLWYHELISGQRPECFPEEMESNEPFAIIYTPNHEGRMVGVIYSHGGFMVGLSHSMELAYNLKETDVIWWNTEPGDILNLAYTVYGPLLKGITTVLYEGHLLYPRAERIWQIINKYGVTILGTYPSRLRALIPFGQKPIKSWDHSTLRTISLSGEKFDERLSEWLYENIFDRPGKIKNFWITAELGVFTLISSIKVETKKSIFSLSPFRCLIPIACPSIVDENGNVLSKGQEGVLAFETPIPSMFTGIWEGETLYLDYFKNGYFCTKDYAFLADEGIELLGHRSKRAINIGGLIVPAGLVESAIEKHSAVAAVVAQPMEDSVKGQVVELKVKLKPEVELDHEIRVELLRYAKSELGEAVIIGFIEFI